MLNKYRNVSCRYRYMFVDKNVRITLFTLLILKKKQVNKFFIYNGSELSEKKFSYLDLNNTVGHYTVTRKLFAKPEKFFKFKY